MGNEIKPNQTKNGLNLEVTFCKETCEHNDNCPISKAIKNLNHLGFLGRGTIFDVSEPMATAGKIMNQNRLNPHFISGIYKVPQGFTVGDTHINSTDITTPHRALMASAVCPNHGDDLPMGQIIISFVGKRLQEKIKGWQTNPRSY